MDLARIDRRERLRFTSWIFCIFIDGTCTIRKQIHSAQIARGNRTNTIMINTNCIEQERRYNVYLGSILKLVIFIDVKAREGLKIMHRHIYIIISKLATCN